MTTQQLLALDLLVVVLTAALYAAAGILTATAGTGEVHPHVPPITVREGEVIRLTVVNRGSGIWMAHCHNLDHATQGMVVHLAYEGVSTPFGLGGHANNRPE